MPHDELVRSAEAYYTERFRAHGATPAGVDWNSRESQDLRFRQLLRLVNGATAFTLLDYGCGFGALAELLPSEVDYTGFDVSEPMIEHARVAHPAHRFTTARTDLNAHDYA